MRLSFLREIRIERPNVIPERYPWNLPAFEGLSSLRVDGTVTFFVGDNGSGKSTFLEGIASAAGFNPEGGGRNAAYDVGHTDRALAEGLRLVWNRKVLDGFFFRAESFFNYASYVDEIQATKFYGGKSLHHQSYGESFLSLFTHRLDPRRPSLYLFDEPEAALSTTAQLAFLIRMNQWVQSEAVQLIVATHSPILIAFPNARIYDFSHHPPKIIRYQESDAYQRTKSFLDAPEVFLKELFADNDT